MIKIDIKRSFIIYDKLNIMPLSRHFYSLDEVQAAFLYTTTCSKIQEALFWAQEVIQSGCIGEAISTLFQSWLWHTGPMRLEWLINAWELLGTDSCSVEDILLSAYRLSSIPSVDRDNSLWNILCLTGTNPNKMPDRVTKKTPVYVPSKDSVPLIIPRDKINRDVCDETELYFIRSLFQGKAQSAWWASMYLAEERVWILLEWFSTNIRVQFEKKYKKCLDALRGYEQLLGYKSAEYDIIIRCMAVIMLSINSEKQNSSFRCESEAIDKRYIKEMREWETVSGRMSRRIYSPPKECLYGVTLRGRLKWTQNNMVQLNNVEKYLIGCPIWDESLAEYADVSEDGIIKWHSDDKQEEFYEMFFPDDIPDEWVKSEKVKSHGDGIIGPNDKVNMWKFSRTFMTKMPHLAWNTTKTVLKSLEGFEAEECAIEKIAKPFFKWPGELTEENLKKLAPVRKVRIVGNY
jgi:hypothetical protein